MPLLILTNMKCYTSRKSDVNYVPLGAISCSDITPNHELSLHSQSLIMLTGLQFV
jgi:hypothetical protein